MARTALILPILFGVIGTAILTGFAFWQLARSDWKEGLIAEHLEPGSVRTQLELPRSARPREADGRIPAGSN